MQKSYGSSNRWAHWAVALLLAIFTAQVAHSQSAAQRHTLQTMTGVARTHANTTGTQASNTSLSQPHGLAWDASGDLYIADTDNHRVLEVDTSGAISTVAGTGTQGYSGDGGEATSAQLDSPAGIVLSSSGDLYIADSHNNRIRKITSGVITTVAGNGTAGYSGDSGTAITAGLHTPTALALDSSGNLYIADTGNHCIRKVSAGIITTIAGTGVQGYSNDGVLATTALLSSPSGVAVDRSLNIYISDTGNQRIRLIDNSTGIISTLAGTGTQGYSSDGMATLARPYGLAVSNSGVVYFADSDNNVIRMISGGQVTTLAGSGTQGNSGDTGSSTSATLDTPLAVALFNDAVAIADTNNETVRLVSSSGINTISGQKNGPESLVLSGSSTITYGTGTITGTFSNGTQIASGSCLFLDGLGSSPTTLATQAFSSNVASYSTSKLTGGTHYLIASYAGDSNNAAVVSSVFVLTVAKASSTTTLNASSSLLEYGATETLTATVVSSVGVTPTGTVSFYDGSTLLNSTGATLSSSGVATLAIATLSSGTHNITAVYSGDTNYQSSTSTAVTITLQTSDFTMSASQSALSILPSGTSSYTLTVTPSGTTFLYPISFTVSGLPDGVTASFSPSTVAAGSAESKVAVTFTASSQARMLPPASAPWRRGALALCLLVLCFGRKMRKTARHIHGSTWIALAVLALTSLFTACGGRGFFTHKGVSYTVTITASGGTYSHTSNVTLTVQ